MHTDVCEASLRREQPADVHELRMQCLADRLDTLRADVDLMVKPDQTAVEKSLRAIESLPSVAGLRERCGAPGAISAAVRSRPAGEALQLECPACGRHG